MQSLNRSGIVTPEIEIQAETVIFGTGSSLDSIAFVTFVTDVEERLNRETGKDLYIVLTDIEDRYPGAPQLTSAMFADYLVGLSVE